MGPVALYKLSGLLAPDQESLGTTLPYGMSNCRHCPQMRDSYFVISLTVEVHSLKTNYQVLSILVVI